MRAFLIVKTKSTLDNYIIPYICVMYRDIIKGEDYPVAFEIEGTNGSKLNNNDINGLLISIFYRDSRTLIKKFSYNTLSGYDPITWDQEKMEFQVILGRDITINLDRNKILAIEGKYKMNNANFLNGEFHDITKDPIDLGQIKPSTLSSDVL